MSTTLRTHPRPRVGKHPAALEINSKSRSTPGLCQVRQFFSIEGHRSGLTVEFGVAGCRDMRARATRGPALVVDGYRVQCHVGVRVLDVALQHGHVAAEAHRADPRLVQ